MGASGPHVLIVESRYYEGIAAELLRGATNVLDAAGCSYRRVDVPGALEIPAAIAIAHGGPVAYDGYVALGCVIRGETSHYDIVAGESARALMDLAINHRIVIGNGILTVENRRQAEARSSVSGKDKGGVAARACLGMIGLRQDLLNDTGR